ncbi:hypothetical protein ACFYPK_07505 [Streptomyces halstedii]|uniref:hypothetical protein n=1 Tax=Streptomyces halstedii TaxID=1944 RepID=UPI00368F5D5C
MAYGTAAQPASRVDATYEAVILHTADCAGCNDDDQTCATGDRLRADHRQAQRETRR